MTSGILLVGGDRRQTELARLLSESFTVYTLGVPGRPDNVPAQASRLVLPCPAFTPEGALRGSVGLAQLEPYLLPGVRVYGGQLGNRLAGHPVEAVDLLAEEKTVAENARLTAEAAVALVMEKTGQSLCRRRCLVIGYGRIGKVLGRLLAQLGAEVTVAARKAGDRALAAGLGLQSCPPGDEASETYDLVFNTAPAQVLTRQSLARLRGDCLWLELASSPGGLPPEGEAGFRFCYLAAAGLPGKLLPVSAAQVLQKAILRYESHE